MSKTDPSPTEDQYLPVSAEAGTNDLAKVTIVHPFEEDRRQPPSYDHDANFENVYEHLVDIKSKLLNPHILRQFSMQGLLTDDKMKELYGRERLYQNLSGYSNLSRAVSAIKYVKQTYMTMVPVVFQKWKEQSFEGRAKRILNVVSGTQSRTEEPEILDDLKEGRESGRSDLENYFFRDHGSGQGEMVQMPEGSYSILPLDSSEFYQEHNRYGYS